MRLVVIPVVYSKGLATGDKLATDVSFASLYVPSTTHYHTHSHIPDRWITAVFGTLSVVVTLLRSFTPSSSAPSAHIMTQSLQETPLNSLPRHMRYLYSHASIDTESDQRHTMKSANEVEVQLGGYGGKTGGVKVPERAQYKFR